MGRGKIGKKKTRFLVIRLSQEVYDTLHESIDNVSAWARETLESAMVTGLREGLRNKKAVARDNVLRKKEELLEAERAVESIERALVKLEALKEKSNDARFRELEIFRTRVDSFRTRTKTLEEAVKQARKALGARVDTDILMETGFDSPKELLDWCEENARKAVK